MGVPIIYPDRRRADAILRLSALLGQNLGGIGQSFMQAKSVGRRMKYMDQLSELREEQMADRATKRSLDRRYGMLRRGIPMAPLSTEMAPSEALDAPPPAAPLSPMEAIAQVEKEEFPLEMVEDLKGKVLLNEMREQAMAEKQREAMEAQQEQAMKAMAGQDLTRAMQGETDPAAVAARWYPHLETSQVNMLLGRIPSKDVQEYAPQVIAALRDFTVGNEPRAILRAFQPAMNLIRSKDQRAQTVGWKLFSEIMDAPDKVGQGAGIGDATRAVGAEVAAKKLLDERERQGPVRFWAGSIKVNKEGVIQEDAAASDTDKAALKKWLKYAGGVQVQGKMKAAPITFDNYTRYLKAIIKRKHKDAGMSPGMSLMAIEKEVQAFFGTGVSAGGREVIMGFAETTGWGALPSESRMKMARAWARQLVTEVYEE
jgi:hypothetical protein